jgi:hypothetical protein
MPKKYAKHGRNKRKPNPRQQKFVKGIASGKTLTQAAIDAGYSSKYPNQSGYQALAQLRGRVPELLERHGLGEEVLIEKYNIYNHFLKRTRQSSSRKAKFGSMSKHSASATLHFVPHLNSTDLTRLAIPRKPRSTEYESFAWTFHDLSANTINSSIRFPKAL